MNGQIQQALHGYSRGHRLLSCSMELPQAVLRKMLYLSDLSGTNRAEGFEHYLTAYPLPEIAMFALGQTWEAPEMERPGCVFTHTILVDYSDLGQISDLSSLLFLFRRPTKGEAFQSYQELLPIPQARPAHQLNKTKILSLLDALYGSDEQSIVIAARQSDEWLEVILAAWSQMWPRLRRQFTFSTGSLGPRTIDGEPFALQVIPSRWQVRMERDFPQAIWLGDETKPKATGGWLSALAEDCAVAELAEWRSFLRQQAADLPPRRSLLPLLWRMWEWQRGKEADAAELHQNTDLLAAIATAFPHSDEAVRLKTELLNTGVQHPDKGHSLLVALGTTPEFEAFESLGPTCADRLLTLWHSDKNAGWEIVFALVRTQRNVLADEMLRVLGNALTIKDIKLVAGKYPATLLLWLPSHPDWLTQPDLWKLSEALQKRMLDWIAEDQLRLSDQLPLVLDHFITHGASALAADAEQIFGSVLLDRLLTLLEAGRLVQPLATSWLDVLRRNQSHVLRWLARGPRESKALVALVPLLSPSALLENGPGLRDQASDLLPAAERADPSTHLILHALRCYLGLCSRHKQAHELLYTSFQITYNSVRAGTLHHVWAQYILDNVPKMKTIRPTHTEDRLFIALWSHFAAEQWDLGYLFRILSDRIIMTHFVGLLRYSDERNSLKLLRKYSKRHPEKLTSEQRDILNEQSLKEWLQTVLGGSPLDED